VSTCTACKTGWLVKGTGCVQTCGNGYYTAAIDCQACTDTNCDTCSTDVSICTECKAGWLVKDTGCVQTCGNGYYTGTTNCQACTDTNCDTCSTDVSTCTACKEGWLLKGNSCVESCGSGYYVSGSTCQACSDSNCDICPNNVCSTCSSGFYLPSGSSSGTQSTCQACSESNCNICSLDICSSCGPGFYLQDTSCVSSCGIGEYIDGSECHVCSEPDCDTCDADTCSLCKPGYYLSEADGNSCLSCSSITSNCISCSSVSAQCTGCDAGLYLQDNQCVTSCGAEYSISGSLCIPSTRQINSNSKDTNNGGGLSIAETITISLCGFFIIIIIVFLAKSTMSKLRNRKIKNIGKVRPIFATKLEIKPNISSANPNSVTSGNLITETI